MYTIADAAARSGLGIAVLRAWDRRYGIVNPVRTPAGYRHYDEDAIARLWLMRELVAAGWRPRRAAEHLATIRSPLETPTTGVVPGVLPQPGELVAAARDLDLVRIERMLGDVLGRATFEAAVDDVLAPALRDVGVAWADGRLDVAAAEALRPRRRRLPVIRDGRQGR